MSVSIADIISAIEEAAPRQLQEQWDNCGLLVGSPDAECTGVMVCLDVMPSIIEQARLKGCNLIVSHHPLIFKGIKAVNDSTPQGSALIGAIRSDIAVYCAHTSLDNAASPFGVSWEMARMLDAEATRALSPTGTGVLASLSTPMSADEFSRFCIERFDAGAARTSSPALSGAISTIAAGSGSCGFLIPDAIAAGADAIVTSDVRYHDFLDFGNKIFIVDLTHFDTEKCTKRLFSQIISQKIPNFAHVFCANETNPIEYV